MDRPYTTFLRSFPYGHLPLVHLLGRKWSTFGTPTRSKHVRPRGRAKDEACLIMTLRIKVLNQYLPNQIGLYQIMSLQFYSHKSIDHGLSIDSLHMHVYTFSTPTPRIAHAFSHGLMSPSVTSPPDTGSVGSRLGAREPREPALLARSGERDLGTSIMPCAILQYCTTAHGTHTCLPSYHACFRRLLAMTLNNWNIKCRVLAGTKGKGSLQKSKLETKHHMVYSQVTATSAEEGGALPAKAHGGTGGCGGQRFWMG